jgi:hypothetical protein
VETIQHQRELETKRLDESISNYEASIASLKLDLKVSVDTCKKFESKAKDYLQEIEMLQNKMSSEMENHNRIISELRKERSLLIEQHKIEIDELGQKHQDQLLELHQQSTEEISKFRDDISGALHQQQQKMQDRYKQEIEVLKERALQAESEFQNQIQTLVFQHKEELTTLRASVENESKFKYDEMLESIIRDNENRHQEVLMFELNEKERAHSEILSKLLLEHENNLFEESSRLKEESSMRLQEAMASCEASYESKLEDMKTSHNEELLQLQTAHDEEIQKIRAQHYQLVSNIEQTHSLSLQESEFKLGQVQEDHINELNSLKHDHTLHLEEYATKISDMQSKHAIEMEEVRNANANMIKDIKTKHKRHVKSISEDYDNQINTLKSEYEHVKQENLQTIDKLKSSMNDLIDQHKLELNKALQQQESELNAAYESDRKIRDNEHILDLETKLANEKALLLMQLESMKNECQLQVDSLKQSNAIIVEQEKMEQKRELEMEYASRLKQMEEKHNQQMTTEISRVLQSGRESTKERLESQLFELSRVHEAALSEVIAGKDKHWEEVLRKATLSHEEQLNDLKASMRIQLENMEIEHKSELDQAMSDSEKRLLAEIEKVRMQEGSALSIERVLHQKEILSLQQQLEAANNSFHEEIRQLNANHRNMLANVIREKDQVIENERENHLRNMKLEIATITAQQDNRLQRRLEDAEAAFELKMYDVMEEMRSKLELQHSEEIRELKQQSQREDEDRIARTKSRYDVELLELRKAIADQRRDLESKHEQALERCMADHERHLQSELDRVRGEGENLREMERKMHEKELALVQEELQRSQHALAEKSSLLLQLNQSIQKLKDDMALAKIENESFHNAKIVQVQNDSNIRHQEELANVTANLKKEYSEALSQVQMANIEASQRQLYEANVAHMKDLQTKLDEQRMELENCHALEIGNILKVQGTTVEDVLSRAQVRHESELNDLRTQVNEVRIRLEEKHFNTLQQCRDDYNNRIQAEIQRVETECNKVKLRELLLQEKKFSDLHEDLCRTHKNEISELKNQLNLEFEQILQEKEAMVMLAESTKRIELEAQLNESVALKLENQRNKLARAHAEEIALLVSQHESRLKREINELQYQYEEKLMDKSEELRIKYDEIRKAEINQLQVENNRDTEDRLQRMQSRYDVELLELRKAMADQRRDLESKHEQALERCMADHERHLQSELDRVRGEGENLREMERKMHEKELALVQEELQKQYDRTMSAVTASANERLSLEHIQAELQFEKKLHDALQNQQDQLTLEFEENAIKLRNAMIQEWTAKLGNEVESMRNEMNRALDRQREELETNHANALKQRDEHLRELNSDFSSQKSNMVRQHNLDTERQLEQLRSELELKHKDLEMRLTARHNDRVQEILLEQQLQQVEYSKSLAIIKEKDTDIMRLQSHLNEMEDRYKGQAEATVNARISDLTLTHEKAFKACSEEYEKVKRSLDQRIVILSASIEKLQTESTQQKHTIDSYMSTESRLKQQLLELELQCDDLQSSLDISRSNSASSLIQLKSEIENAHKLEVLTLTNKYESKLNDQMATHSSDLSSMRQSHIFELSQMSDTIHNLELELSSSKNQQHTDTAKLQLLHEKKLRDSLEQLENTLSLRHTSEMSSLLKELADLRSRLAEAESMQSSYDQELLRVRDIHADEIASLKIQSNRNVQNVELQLVDAKSLIESKDDELQRCKTTISSLQSELDNSNKESLLALEQSREQQMLVIQELQQQIQNYESELIRIKAENINKSDELSSIMNHHHTLESELRSKVEMLNEMLSVEKQSQHEEVLLLNGKHESDIESLKSNLQIANMKVTGLSTECQNLTSTASKLQEEVEIYKREKNQFEEKESALSATIQDLTSKNVNMLAEIEMLKSNYNSKLTENVTSVQETLEQKYKSEIANLKEDFDRQLSSQREKMQDSYLSLLQQQMEKLMITVNSKNDNSSLPRIEGMCISVKSILLFINLYCSILL